MFNDCSAAGYGATSVLPAAKDNQVYVRIAALHGGFVTLPERLFVTNADPDKVSLVPSMCFLIEHQARPDEKPTRIVFDLGIKRNLREYSPGMYTHISKRQPIKSLPDTRSSLLDGGLDPCEIDTVILSHGHWDHIGTPSDFLASNFVVGYGTQHVFANGAPNYPADMFIKDELPISRTLELPPTPNSPKHIRQQRDTTDHKWQPLAGFPYTIDYFGDGSMYIIDTPGHLTGHVNLLLRLSPNKWVYLGGDCCHDTRILKGEKEIATYDDGCGGIRSVHMDLKTAQTTIKRIQAFLDSTNGAVEWIIAHDREWAAENPHRFFPNWL